MKKNSKTSAAKTQPGTFSRRMAVKLTPEVDAYLTAEVARQTAGKKTSPATKRKLRGRIINAALREYLKEQGKL